MNEELIRKQGQLMGEIYDMEQWLKEINGGYLMKQNQQDSIMKETGRRAIQLERKIFENKERQREIERARRNRKFNRR